MIWKTQDDRLPESIDNEEERTEYDLPPRYEDILYEQWHEKQKAKYECLTAGA